MILVREDSCARLSHGYAEIAALERQCACLQFQDPRTKLQLFYILVTPPYSNFQYNLDCNYLNMNKAEMDRVFQIDIINVENKVPLINSIRSPARKMTLL